MSKFDIIRKRFNQIPVDEEFDILRLELEYLGITIEEIEGLFDIKVVG